jgi:hypothetical protein
VEERYSSTPSLTSALEGTEVERYSSTVFNLSARKHRGGEAQLYSVFKLSARRHRGGERYSSTVFNLGARWGWVVNATPRPLLTPSKDPVPDGPQGQCGRVRKISPQPGFDSVAAPIQIFGDVMSSDFIDVSKDRSASIYSIHLSIQDTS